MSATVSSRAEIPLRMLRDGRRSLLVWAGAFAAMVALYAAIWPSMRGNTQWQDLLNTLPPAYRALFMAGGQLDLTTPAGYLGLELMGFLGPALFAVYAIGAGAGAIAGEEHDGGLEVTLSAPVSRASVLAGRSAAMVAELAVTSVATGAALWIFSLIFDMHLGIAGIASAAAALGVFGLFCGAVALAVGAATGSAPLAKGLAALAAVASYLINALSQVTTALRSARPVSPFYLLFGNEPLQHGLRVWGALAVTGAGLALVVAAGVVFARRDLS